MLEHSGNNDDDSNISLFGERFATAFVIFYTSSALLISGISFLALHIGIDCGGPVEHFVHLLQRTGIV